MNMIVGCLGATSLIGQKLIPMLESEVTSIHAMTTREISARQTGSSVIRWHTINPDDAFPDAQVWISMMSIWYLPSYFEQLRISGIKRLIVFSSTSVLTKIDSIDDNDRQTANKLRQTELKIEQWAKENDIEYTILRPTLIYDEGKDKNISVIASFIKKASFFPIIGEGKGLRMPVAAEDLADAVMKILKKSNLPLNYYNLSGGEELSYREMVNRIFKALNKKPVIIKIPTCLLIMAIKTASFLPMFRHLTPSMALRMQNLKHFCV